MSIEVQGITKVFANRRDKKSVNTVLEDISFDVKEGEFVTLLGPSGCGKTTTLNIIAGFLKHEGGSIRVTGKKVDKPGPDRAFVFQSYALFPWMKVKDNIMYPMKLRGVPKKDREDRLKYLLEMAQLEGYGDHYVHEISGGMMQRVALLRALSCDPEILLMDEPLGAVDFQMRQLLQVQLERIVRDNEKTALMVTHDVDEAIYLSDRVIIMSRDRGQILADIKIELPRPRDRKSERYHQYSNEISDILRFALNNEVKNEGDEELFKFIQSKSNNKQSNEETTFEEKTVFQE